MIFDQTFSSGLRRSLSDRSTLKYNVASTAVKQYQLADAEALVVSSQGESGDRELILRMAPMILTALHTTLTMKMLLERPKIITWMTWIQQNSTTTNRQNKMRACLLAAAQLRIQTMPTNSKRRNSVRLTVNSNV